MRLEYLPGLAGNGHYLDGCPDGLIRLFAFTQEEVKKLIAAIQSSLIDNKSSLEFSTLPFVQPINCQLIMELATEKIGINPSITNNFVCQLSIEDYRQMIGYLQAFADMQDLKGYNWMYDPPMGKIDLLFSVDGSW